MQPFVTPEAHVQCGGPEQPFDQQGDPYSVNAKTEGNGEHISDHAAGNGKSNHGHRAGVHAVARYPHGHSGQIAVAPKQWQADHANSQTHADEGDPLLGCVVEL